MSEDYIEALLALQERAQRGAQNAEEDDGAQRWLEAIAAARTHRTARNEPAEAEEGKSLPAGYADEGSPAARRGIWEEESPGAAQLYRELRQAMRSAERISAAGAEGKGGLHGGPTGTQAMAEGPEAGRTRWRELGEDGRSAISTGEAGAWDAFHGRAAATDMQLVDDYFRRDARRYDRAQ